MKRVDVRDIGSFVLQGAADILLTADASVSVGRELNGDDFYPDQVIVAGEREMVALVTGLRGEGHPEGNAALCAMMRPQLLERWDDADIARVFHTPAAPGELLLLVLLEGCGMPMRVPRAGLEEAARRYPGNTEILTATVVLGPKTGGDA